MPPPPLLALSRDPFQMMLTSDGKHSVLVFFSSKLSYFEKGQMLDQNLKPPGSGPEEYYFGPEGYYLVVLFRAASGLWLVVITTD